MRTRPWAMGCHLPYGITQYYLPPDTSECVPPQPPRFTYPGGMEGWVDLAYPAVHRPGVELAIFWWQVRRPNHYTTEPPKWRVFQCLHLTLCYVCIMSLAVLYIMFYINSQFTYLLTYLHCSACDCICCTVLVKYCSWVTSSRSSPTLWYIIRWWKTWSVCQHRLQTAGHCGHLWNYVLCSC